MFSTVDANNWYWQVKRDDETYLATAFRLLHGVYRFQCMPFGLCHAPGTFWLTMYVILLLAKWRIDFVYRDNIIKFFKIQMNLYHMFLPCCHFHTQMSSRSVWRSASSSSTIMTVLKTYYQEILGIGSHYYQLSFRLKPLFNVTELESFLSQLNLHCRFVQNFSLIEELKKVNRRYSTPSWI